MTHKGESLQKEMVQDDFTEPDFTFPEDAGYGMKLFKFGYIVTFVVIFTLIVPMVTMILKQHFQSVLLEESSREWSKNKCMIAAFSYMSLIMNVLVIIGEGHQLSNLNERNAFITLKIWFLTFLLFECGVVSAFLVFTTTSKFKHCSYIHKFGLWLSLLSVTLFISCFLLSFVPLIVQIIAYPIDTAALLTIHYAMIYTFTVCFSVFLHFASIRLDMLHFCSSQDKTFESSLPSNKITYKEICTRLFEILPEEDYDPTLIQLLAQKLAREVISGQCILENKELKQTFTNKVRVDSLHRQHCTNHAQCGLVKKPCRMFVGEGLQTLACKAANELIETVFTELAEDLTQEITPYVMTTLCVHRFKVLAFSSNECDDVEAIMERLRQSAPQDQGAHGDDTNYDDIGIVDEHIQKIVEKFVQQVLLALSEQFAKQLQLQSTGEAFQTFCSKVSSKLRRDAVKQPLRDNCIEILTHHIFCIVSRLSKNVILSKLMEKLESLLKQKMNSELAEEEDEEEDCKLNINLLVRASTCLQKSHQITVEEGGRKLFELIPSDMNRKQFISSLTEKMENDGSFFKADFLSLEHQDLATGCIRQITKKLTEEKKKIAESCSHKCEKVLSKVYLTLILTFSLPILITIYTLVVLMFQILAHRYTLNDDIAKALSAFLPSLIATFLAYFLNRHVWH